MPGPVARPRFLAVLAALCALPGLSPAEAFPRGGGFGGGGFGGGPRFGGGGFHFGGEGYNGRGSVEDWQRGYQGVHPLYGPASRPAWNGKDSWNNDSWPPKKTGNVDNNVTKDSNNVIQKNVTVNNNFYNRMVNGWNANWARGGYWSSRPWSSGWYAWTPATWGWWGWNSVGWGLAAGLATGAAITELVNNAANARDTVIVVPGGTYQLNYASVEAVGLYGVSFSYGVGAGVTLNGAANCQAGLLNGQVPANAAQAQLLNAVCQVAYGKGG